MKDRFIKAVLLPAMLLLVNQSYTFERAKNAARGINRRVRNVYNRVLGHKTLDTKFFDIFAQDCNKLLTAILQDFTPKLFAHAPLADKAMIANRIEAQCNTMLREIIDANALKMMQQNNPEKLTLLVNRVPESAGYILQLHKALVPVIENLNRSFPLEKAQLTHTQKFFSDIVRPIETCMNTLNALAQLELTSTNEIAFFEDIITDPETINKEIIFADTINKSLGNKQPILDPTSTALKKLHTNQWATWDVAKWATAAGITIGIAYYLYSNQDALSKSVAAYKDTALQYLSDAASIARDSVSYHAKRLGTMLGITSQNTLTDQKIHTEAKETNSALDKKISHPTTSNQSAEGLTQLPSNRASSSTAPTEEEFIADLFSRTQKNNQKIEDLKKSNEAEELYRNRWDVSRYSIPYRNAGKRIEQNAQEVMRLQDENIHNQATLESLLEPEQRPSSGATSYQSRTKTSSVPNNSLISASVPDFIKKFSNAAELNAPTEAEFVAQTKQNISQRNQQIVQKEQEIDTQRRNVAALGDHNSALSLKAHQELADNIYTKTQLVEANTADRAMLEGLKERTPSDSKLTVQPSSVAEQTNRPDFDNIQTPAQTSSQNMATAANRLDTSTPLDLILLEIEQTNQELQKAVSQMTGDARQDSLLEARIYFLSQKLDNLINKKRSLNK